MTDTNVTLYFQAALLEKEQLALIKEQMELEKAVSFNSSTLMSHIILPNARKLTGDCWRRHRGRLTLGE